MADEVGSIALKLRLDGSDLTGQFEKISQDMQKQMIFLNKKTLSYI